MVSSVAKATPGKKKVKYLAIPVQQRKQTMSSEHLEPLVSKRGFDHMPPVPSTYGGQVRVYESSAASGPHIWLLLDDVPDNLNDPAGVRLHAFAHLKVENALKLAEQIQKLCKDHYQGAEPNGSD